MLLKAFLEGARVAKVLHSEVEKAAEIEDAFT
jgi:hypothetical protein